MFYSQAGQDVWVLQKIGNRGFFVDVGAHDGVESSNTYALQRVGWTGICVDSNVKSVMQMSQNRRPPHVCAMIGAVDDYNFKKLSSLLHDLTAPVVIDYLSIDVDGGELDVLKGMDFDKYHVRLITIEHNKYAEGTARKQQIYEYLTNEGFRRTHEDVKCLDGEWFGLEYEDWYENISLIPDWKQPRL